MSSKPYVCISCAGDYPKEYCLELYDGREYCRDNAEQAEEPQVLSFDPDLTEEKEEKVLKDPVSAGRKRAAVIYKIEPGQICDWAWKKHAGGGIYPIVGCTGRPASHIHHGPDKSTLNNERSNISLVCEFCHNRWHVANDKTYTTKRPEDNSAWLPDDKGGIHIIHKLSDMQVATKQEILMNELLIPEGGKDVR